MFWALKPQIGPKQLDLRAAGRRRLHIGEPMGLYGHPGRSVQGRKLAADISTRLHGPCSAIGTYTKFFLPFIE
ncbi:unnamed protein product [Linum tenue]|uniref:Uncharacterized protein n=1 Tax=Linum tenue TaxID=586396 RepID=A0AAV0J3K5_9ROSI|nr:unnamed protein product [Linum tenue]